MHAVRAAGPSPRRSRPDDRGRSPMREHRDHRPLTRALQARGNHLSVSRARLVWLTCSWAGVLKDSLLILSLVSMM